MSQIRGRFHKAAGENTTKYTASIPFDWRLYPYDIAGSIAHAEMLAKQGIINSKDSKTIVAGLEAIKKEIDGGKFDFKIELEDIHMNIEASLIEKVGEVGRKLHTARSRNDQVALDMRLFVGVSLLSTVKAIHALQKAVLDLAGANKKVIIPGFTHLQPAQPVLLAHHLLAYFEMLQRDGERFTDCFRHTMVMPLGSGALAGVSYAIDREFVAEQLGFGEISRNSIDAVSDRDFILEYESAASICAMHLSRLAEEFVIWSSPAFGFIEIDDAYATGSSIMPQKKNPDVAELARGKTGRVYGNLMAMLTIMKALPLAYDRDMQEDKEGLFDTVDTLLSTLEVFTGMLGTIHVNSDNMRKALDKGYLLATDVADYLVTKGEAFRSAHGIVGKLVGYAVSKDKSLGELSLAEYKKFSPLFAKDVLAISVESSLASRNVPGGTAPAQVAKALARAKRMLSGK